MYVDWEYYKIFYYVAKYGNLTRAAAALNTSQPAVTRVIHKLESDLGCRLFVRSKSGMELTAEGSRFFEYVSAGCLQFFRAENHEMCFERSVHRCFLKSCERLLVPVCRLPPGYPAGAARFHFSWGCTASWRGGVDNCGPAVF